MVANGRSVPVAPDAGVGASALRAPSLARDAALVLAGSLAVAVAAQVAVPFPGSPVPVTAQTFALLVVGIGLGARRGALALALYLLEGVAGLPVFAGGASGPAAFVGPTAGYLLAFPLAALVAGALASPRSPWLRIAVASLASHAVVFAFGLAWLARFVGAGNVVATGFVPFLPGEALKIVATVLVFRGWALAPRRSSTTHS
jgi:biotin transport system substrate-specific component